MACYPMAAAATAWHRMHDPPRTRHDGKRQFGALGDRWRNWPLVPDGMKLDLEQAADLDIRRAIRAGLDGFAVDAWAGGENAKKYLSAMFKVAEAKNYPFELTICIDAGSVPHGTAAVKWLLENHGQSPKLARRDGKLLIFGYLSVFPGFRHGAEVLKERPKNADKNVRELHTDPWLRTTPEGWAVLAQAQLMMEEAVGQEIYWHYGMWAFFHRVPHQLWDEDKYVEAAAFMAKRFEAIGEFLGNGERHDRMAKPVRDAGAEWCQPLYFQYENINWGGNRIRPGQDLLRKCWADARKNQSTLIQFITWNDYTENTHLAPAYDTRHAVMHLNRHFVDWWKSGSEPKPQRDKLYLFYREYPKGAKVFPFQTKQPDAGGRDRGARHPHQTRDRAPGGARRPVGRPGWDELPAVRTDAGPGGRGDRPRRRDRALVGEPRASDGQALPRAELHGGDLRRARTALEARLPRPGTAAARRVRPRRRQRAAQLVRDVLVR